MSKAKANQQTIYGCTECGATTPRWAGRCQSCGAMNSLKELSQHEQVMQSQSAAQHSAAHHLSFEQLEGDSVEQTIQRIATSLGECDRVLGGGLALGSAVVIGGEPGIGKSTLLAQVSAAVAQQVPVLYASAEESCSQVRDRCNRLQLSAKQLQLTSTGDANALAGVINQGQFRLVVIDSIQLVSCTQVDGVPGSPSQVRACATLLIEAAKRHGVTVVFVGHVTKDGALAGPRLLEHLVDTVLHFEGDRYHDLRTLRAVKNRFGSTNEIGLFEMAATGLQEVADPGGWFISNRDQHQPGSCVVPIVEGNRCLLVEVQALVNQSELPQPQRKVSGCSHNRVAMILAVLARRLRLPLGRFDVFVNVTGGASIQEPAADLAIALALVSAHRDQAIPPAVVAMGELGLGGELRPAGRYELRAAEARRLGFKQLVGPGPGKGRGRLIAHDLVTAVQGVFSNNKKP